MLEYLNGVSQVAGPAVHELQDALSRAVGLVTAPLERLALNTWLASGAAAGVLVTLVLVGLLLLVVAYLTLRGA